MLQQNSTGASLHCQHAGGPPPWSLILAAGCEMVQLFMECVHLGLPTSILEVGITSDSSFAKSNYFEKIYPRPHRIVFARTEDGSSIENTFPGLRYERVVPRQELPFHDSQFDIVFSDVVLEYIGGEKCRRTLIHELCQMADHFYHDSQQVVPR